MYCDRRGPENRGCLCVCVSVCVCVCDAKLLRDRWTDLLQIWWKDASNTRTCPYLYFMTLTPRSRSPGGQMSNLRLASYLGQFLR